MGRFKSVLSKLIVKSTDIEMHLSMKLRGILRPKSVRRALVIGLIYGPIAHHIGAMLIECQLKPLRPNL